MTSPSSPRLARRRHLPRLVPFLVTGALLGILAAVVITWLGGPVDGYSDKQSFGYFGVLLAGIGALLGGVAYLVADRRAMRDR